MNSAADIIEQIAEALDGDKIEIPTETYKAIERLLSDWEDDVREGGKDEGESIGYNNALEEERICGDDTMADLVTGIDLMRKGDPCAPTYLDRALRDLGSSYY